MPLDLDQTSPEMAQPAEVVGLQSNESDREGAMAKADLYKLASYSQKLFQQLNDEDQLEGWVQAKITKAADYIASVYHYLEYEMKFSEYGKALDDSDVLSESQKIALKSKLMEAKSKIKELKLSQAEKAKDKKVDEGALSGGERACTECGGTGMVYEEPKAIPDAVKGKVEKYKTMVKATKAAHKRMDANKNGIPDDEEMEEGFGDAGDKEMKVGDKKKTRTGELEKTATGVKHTNTSYKDDGEAEEKSGKGVKSHAKAQSAAEKKEKAPAQKQSPKSAKTWGKKDGVNFDNRDGAPAKPKKEKDVGEGVYEGSKMRSASPKDMPAKGNKIGKEGNAFGKAVQDAKASGDKTMTVGGKTMPVKETAVSGAPQKSGIPATAKTTVPGMRATGADLKKANASAALGEGKCNESAKGKMCPVHGLKECGSMYEAATKTMSRAAKGHEKYGKEGMAALAKAGKEGKSLEPIKAKYNKYDESVESGDKKPCPPMSHIKKMCQDGKSVAEICKMHPNCDQKELKQMVADCKKTLSEAAKYRAVKYKDKLYTQEPRDYDQYDYGDDDYYNPKPDDYPGEKNLKGGGEFDHNDPLRKGYGRGGTGSMNTHGKRKGMPSRDHVSSLKGSIKAAHGTHPRPNLPETAAAMWNDIKETQAYIAEKKAIEKKDMLAKGNKVADEGNEFSGNRDDAIKAGKKEFKVDGKTFPVTESADLTRLRELTKHLLG